MAQRVPDAAAIRRAVDVLLHGGLVAFPTETVYGLGADADQADAVASIFAAKGRPRSHPLILHVWEAAAAGAWAREISAPARLLMERFWPGPLTLILPRTPRAGDLVTGGQDAVGLRCPADPWARALLEAFALARGDPAAALAAPSANRYGRISPTRAEHVREDLGEKPRGSVDFVLDGGPCSLGIESTIVSFVGGDSRARVLRPGGLGRARIGEVLGTEIAIAGEDEDAPRSPGRVRGHYAPRKPLELVDAARLARRAAELAPAPVAILAARGGLQSVPGANVVMSLTASDAPDAYAHELYEVLRRLDAGPGVRLLVARPPTTPDWEAVNDRLRRAAAGSEGALAEAD